MQQNFEGPSPTFAVVNSKCTVGFKVNILLLLLQLNIALLQVGHQQTPAIRISDGRWSSGYFKFITRS